MSLPIEIEYAPEHSAHILRQPPNQPGWITNQIGQVNTFRLAMEHGCLGILAHNYLAGQHFKDIQPNQIVEIIYDDDWIKLYEITAIHRFRATRPNSPYSSFVSIEKDGVASELIKYNRLFDRMYASNTGKLVMQTCIALGDNPTWGRLFIIGKLVDQSITRHA